MIASGRFSQVAAGVFSFLVFTALPTSASAAIAVRWRVVDSWSSGFQAEIAVDNGGATAISGWRLSFDLAASIVDLWGGTVAGHSGDRYDLTPAAWSTSIPAGGSIVIGLVAQSDGGAVSPGGCVFDGAACAIAASGGITPLPAPSGAATPAPTRTATPNPSSLYLGFGPSIEPIYNYGRALQQAWSFLEAQRSGPLPRFDGDLPFFDPATGAQLHGGFLANRLPWRGDSDVDDGADVGLDLTGGWHDAGDHVKFGLPMAFSASFLGWGVLEFEDTLRATGQLERARDNLRWVVDYFVRAHPEPNVLWGQVGQGSIDHSIWAPPEVLSFLARPSWKIDLDHPGPDLAAQTSSALAILSLVFRDEPAYAAVLRRHAVELYDFAQATRAPETPTDKSLGRYSDSILDARSYYASTSGAQDDLPWAAAWLYRATGQARYLHDAEADYTRVADNTGHTAWTAVWDDVRYGLYFLMAEIASEPGYAADTTITAAQRQNGYFDYELHARNFLQHWLRNGGVARTPGGMAWLSGWASARYNTMTAFLALVHRQHLGTGGDPVLRQSYLNFATEQLNYVLGDNPLGMSYAVGFGPVWSQVAHHRASHGSTTNNVAVPALPRHVLYGGLAGGPRLDDSYTDDRNEFSLTEVATDMNAGFTGALAGLVQAYGLAGNEPDAAFPPPPAPVDEIFAEARLVSQQPANLGTQVEVSIVNETAYPPRATSGLVFRYFIDLAELQTVGLSAGDVVVDTYRNEGAGAAPLRRWGTVGSIWYVEGSFAGTSIAPIGTSAKRRTIEFLVRLPWGSTAWNAANDFSFAGLGAGVTRTRRIAVYDMTRPSGSQLVWGEEPTGGGPTPTPTRTPSAATSTPTRTATPLAATPTRTATAAPATPTRMATTSLPTATRTSAAGTATRTLTATRTATRTRTPTRTSTAARTATPTRTSTASVRTATATAAGTALVAQVVVESQWSAGYCAGIAVTNTGAQSIRTTTLRFRLPASVVIAQSWNGAITRSGDQVLVQLPSWVGAISPGETQKHFGYCADGDVLPSQPAAP